ncbi:MAG TPA: hypothetical protein PK794_04265 [Armatimonadota bacterium]|nr:hypothetical protein [Armatimonadota bacterium]
MTHALTLDRLTADALDLLGDYQQVYPNGVPDRVLQEIAIAVAPLFTVAEVCHLAATSPALPSPEETPLPQIVSGIFVHIIAALRTAQTTPVHRTVA